MQNKSATNTDSEMVGQSNQGSQINIDKSRHVPVKKVSNQIKIVANDFSQTAANPAIKRLSIS